MASTSSSRAPPENTPNWLDLPAEVTAAILHRLGPIEILNTARKVCVTWRKICNEPSMWKSIDMLKHSDLYEEPIGMEYCRELDMMCRHAVDLSDGFLQHFTVEMFGHEELLHYVADRSPQLRSLRIASCFNLSEEELGEVPTNVRPVLQ